MEWFFFIVVAFIFFSNLSSNGKKKRKKTLNSPHNGGGNPWDEPEAVPESFYPESSFQETAYADTAFQETTYKVRSQAVNIAQAKAAKRRTQKSRQLALKKNRVRAWTKSNFGQKTIAVDKNKARRRGFTNGRVRTVLDGPRVFGLVALSGLAIYILGQV